MKNVPIQIRNSDEAFTCQYKDYIINCNAQIYIFKTHFHFPSTLQHMIQNHTLPSYVLIFQAISFNLPFILKSSTVTIIM